MVIYFWTIGIITLLFYLSFVFFLVLRCVFVTTRFLSDMGLSFNHHSRGSRRGRRGIARRCTRGGGRRVVKVSKVGKISNKNGFARRRTRGGGIG